MRTKVMSPFPKSVYKRNAFLYKILANPKRLEILNILKVHEASVNELAKTLDVSKANMSQHLARLRYARAVLTRRDGLNIYYRITDPRIVEPCRIFKDLWSKSASVVSPL
ncbi:MAG: metalloregulator ArsR/SmtB family transcription factor [Patescibacteria group bacterium]|nr:metalloregulator ArsR/SmtB family transcription factor [Patescibacteria group bacterium]